MFNEKELKELHDEYFAISDKIRELEHRQKEIDIAINNNTKERVASRFIPLEFGDKIRVTRKVLAGGLEVKYNFYTYEGFFGSWVLDGHQYDKNDGQGLVRLRLYQIKKDGSRSLKYDEFYNGSIVSIEKID